jgi:hypothetical protein
MKVESIQLVTPHNKALYEAGKKMLVDSLNVGSDFCKTMINISTGSIPTYLALIKFILPDKYALNNIQVLLVAITSIIFLVTSIIFVLGYLPKVSTFSLDIIDEINKERSIIISKRAKLIKLGMISFVLGITFVIASYLYFLTSIS